MELLRGSFTAQIPEFLYLPEKIKFRAQWSFRAQIPEFLYLPGRNELSHRRLRGVATIAVAAIREAGADDPHPVDHDAPGEELDDPEVVADTAC